MQTKLFFAGILLLAVSMTGVASWRHYDTAVAMPHSPQTSDTQGALRQLTLYGLPAAQESPLTAQPLLLGTPAPDFALPDQTRVIRRLSELRGKFVVLSFYPMDMTMMCASQAISLTGALPDIISRDAVVFGVSTQSPLSKQRFASHIRAGYPLLADETGRVARRYGVLTATGQAARVTFIIGPDGRIMITDDDIRVAHYGQDVLFQLDGLRGWQSPGFLHPYIPLSRS